jgi:hypothetical protein
MEEELKKNIIKNTNAILSKYKQISLKLKKLNVNVTLQEFLTFLDGTIAFYERKYASVLAVDLQACKRQNEPILGLNKVEQTFNALEQGFHSLYPTDNFGDKIRQILINTNTYFDRLHTLIQRIE